ncbi:unnamed protein product [Lupinus luteus]|uniref:non-specific serine/threonine protein kinase n=1 Tax=Lupinus luteus TaxID=3873 RepID=A0AAV1WI02_LUPLU
MHWKRLMLKSLILGCFKAKHPTLDQNIVSKKTCSRRISLSDLSNASAISIMSDLSNSLIGSNLQIFTYHELKEITENFSKSNLLGEGGFGKVYKGFIDEKLRPSLEAQVVAVKALNLDGKQGHREWLTEVVILGQLKHRHLVNLIGYCCEDEYRLLVYQYMERGNLEEKLFKGHLTTMSDVYSFGVVLLELLTGKKSVDKKRPTREQDLVEWARPMLKDSHKLDSIIDPRLEGQYSYQGAKKIASLAYQCLSQHAKFRPTMLNVVKTLEPLMDLTDIPIGHFVYVVPNEGVNEGSIKLNNEKEEEKCERKEKGHQRQRKGHGLRHRSRAVYSDTALYKTLGTSLYSPKQGPETHEHEPILA